MKMLSSIAVFSTQIYCLWYLAIPQLQATSTNVSDTTLSSITITSSKSDNKDLWMESVMLRNVLHWRSAGRSNRYTVFIRSFRSPWQPVVKCTNIASTYCDLSKELIPVITYDIKVETEPKNEAEKYIPIEFRAELDTVLLPPSFNAFRQNDIIFVRPSPPLNMANNESLLQNFVNLHYQVKYWKQNLKDNSIGDVVKKLVSAHNTEITIQKLNTTITYCISLRLYDFSVEERNSGVLKSNWSTNRCFDAIPPNQPLPSTDTAIILVIATVVALLVLISIACLVWKLCAYLRNFGPLPDNLKKAIKELDAERPPAVDQSDSTSENVYLLPDICELQPPSSSEFETELQASYSRTLAALATFYELCVLQTTSDTDSKEHDFESDNLWMDFEEENERSRARSSLEDETDDAHLHQKAIAALRFREPRKRSVSRGYHSASSDDVVSDATSRFSVMSFEDNKSEFDYVQTDTLFDTQYSANTEVFNDVIRNDLIKIPITYSSLSQADDYVREPPRQPIYSHVLWDKSYVNAMQIFTLSKEKTPNDLFLQHFNTQDIPSVYEKGSCNYENLTYCSNLHREIPDALLDHRVLSMSL